ncbi:EI24 domain-containing protein [Mariniluteicoccus flavus]
MLQGIADLVRGIAMVARRPGVIGLGLVPPLISSIVMVGLLVGFGFWVDDLADWLTPFASRWAPSTAGIVRGIVMIILYAAAILLVVLTFSAVTLALGAPIYERIAGRIDDAVSMVAPTGAAERPDQLVGRVVGQVLVTVGLSVVGSVVCFLLGLVPVIGAVIGFLASALFGGWMMARELVGPALERRGFLTLAARAKVLRTRPATVLAFGIPVFWLLAIPFVSIAFFPGAVAGGTLLTRRLLGEPTRPDGQERPVRTDR